VFLPTQSNPTPPVVEAKVVSVSEPSPDELQQEEALETIMTREQEAIAALPVVTPAKEEVLDPLKDQTKIEVTVVV